MFECTVVTCLCSEASEASPRVNCIFHKYQTLGNNYCKAFERLKAHSFVNGTNIWETDMEQPRISYECLSFPNAFILSCSSNPLEKAFFALYEFKTSLNNCSFSCLNNTLLSVLDLVIKSKISEMRHFLPAGNIL